MLLPVTNGVTSLYGGSTYIIWFLYSYFSSFWVFFLRKILCFLPFSLFSRLEEGISPLLSI